MTADQDIKHLLLSLLQGFYWFDEGLQNYLRSKGWPAVTRPQSMVMANVVLGFRRPSDIARNMDVSRQAIHATINQMVKLGILALTDDATNRRVKLLTLTPLGERMRVDAQQAMVVMSDELGRRVGRPQLLKTAHLLHGDWGAPMSFLKDTPRTDS